MTTEIELPHGDLLVAPEHQSWAEASLDKLASTEFAQKFTQKMNSERLANDEDDDFWAEFANTFMERYRPYRVKSGVLTVPVHGMLLNKFPFAMGGLATGYEYIEKAVLRGSTDPEVAEIVLDVNSPGGLVAGCFDCADTLFEVRGTKPIRAVANESAYSAAYAIASAADSINVVRTGGVGSIGVMAAHLDFSKALESQGVKVTLIYEGERKADGHPTQPLSDEAKKRMQARAAHIYGIFVHTVARNRDLDEQMVRGTEAATFMAQEAVENGLADAVGPLGDLSANADPSQQNDEDDEMSNKNDTAVDQAAHERAVEAAKTEGYEAGKAEGIRDERVRVATIMDSEEAKTRPAAARHIALNSAMSAEEAATFLKGLPGEVKASEDEQEQGKSGGGQSQFEASMNSTPNPELGAGAGNQGDQEEVITGDDIFASAGFAPVKK